MPSSFAALLCVQPRTRMCSRRAAIRSARISSTRASASSNPRSRKTLRLAGVVCRIFFVRTILVSNLTQAVGCQLDIRFASLAGLLAKAMKHVDALRPPRQIDHAKSACRIMYPHLIYSRSYGPHGSPIRRLQATLHKVKVKPRISPRLGRKGLQIVQAGPQEIQGFADHAYYINTCINCTSTLLSKTKTASSMRLLAAPKNRRTQRFTAHAAHLPRPTE